MGQRSGAELLGEPAGRHVGDLYWFSDPYNGPGNRFGYKYGEDVKNLRHADLSDGRPQPLWNFVETGWPFSESAAEGARAIVPAELRSAVWHSLIAGARGIIYFQHSFGGPVAHHGLRGECYPENRDMATQVDAQIKSLAAVLNSPFVTSGWTGDADTEAMVKWDGSNFYVFAGARTGPDTMTFSLPCVGNATAAVLGENRSLPVSGGSFTDDFADKNAVHIYRIDGGSTCGLS